MLYVKAQEMAEVLLSFAPSTQQHQNVFHIFGSYSLDSWSSTDTTLYARLKNLDKSN